MPYLWVPIMGVGTEEDPWRPDVGLLAEETLRDPALAKAGHFGLMHVRQWWISTDEYDAENHGPPLTELCRIEVDEERVIKVTTARSPSLRDRLLSPLDKLPRQGPTVSKDPDAVREHLAEVKAAVAPERALAPNEKTVFAEALVVLVGKGLRQRDAEAIAGEHEVDAAS